MKTSKELNKKSSNNTTGVNRLIKDIEHEVWEFQSETEKEDNDIIKGLEKIIKNIKQNGIKE